MASRNTLDGSPSSAWSLADPSNRLFSGIGLAVSVFFGFTAIIPGQVFNLASFVYTMIFVVVYRFLFRKAPYLPFGVMGVWSGWSSHLAARIPDYPAAIGFGAAALSFSGIAVGYHLTSSVTKKEKSEGLIGRKSEIKNTIFWRWIAAWLINSMTLVMLIFLLAYWNRERYDVRVSEKLLLFALFGLASTLWALSGLWRLVYFGIVALEVNGRIAEGGSLNASILFHRTLGGAQEAFLDLHCERQKDEIKQRSTEVLWQNKQVVPIATSIPGIPTRIPFRFSLPAGLPTSHGDDGTPEAIYWILNARIPLRGLDFHDHFYIKVRPSREFDS